jgi:hypothetical protein
LAVLCLAASFKEAEVLKVNKEDFYFFHTELAKALAGK